MVEARDFNNQNQHCWHHAEGTEASNAMELHLAGDLKWNEHGANYNYS